MLVTPMNRKLIPNIYGISKSKASELVRGFLVQANEADYIKDGKILIIDRAAFEEYWKQRAL